MLWGLDPVSLGSLRPFQGVRVAETIFVRIRRCSPLCSPSVMNDHGGGDSFQRPHHNRLNTETGIRIKVPSVKLEARFAEKCKSLLWLSLILRENTAFFHKNVIYVNMYFSFPAAAVTNCHKYSSFNRACIYRLTVPEVRSLEQAVWGTRQGACRVVSSYRLEGISAFLLFQLLEPPPFLAHGPFLHLKHISACF